MSSVTQRSHSTVSRSGFGRLLVTHIHQTESARLGKATNVVLALLLCSVFAFLLPTTASPRTASVSQPRPALVPMSLDNMAREIVYLVNLERAQHALPPLKVNTR